MPCFANKTHTVLSADASEHVKPFGCWSPQQWLVTSNKKSSRSNVMLGVPAKILCVFMPLTLHIWLNMLASHSCFLLFFSSQDLGVSPTPQFTLVSPCECCFLLPWSLCTATVCKEQPVINCTDATIIGLHNVHNAKAFCVLAMVFILAVMQVSTDWTGKNSEMLNLWY